jgi:hypothetical protein
VLQRVVREQLAQPFFVDPPFTQGGVEAAPTTTVYDREAQMRR